MLKERLTQLFRPYDPAIQEIITEVLALEQANISKDRYNFKEPIEQIVARIASRDLEHINKVGDESRGMFDEI